MSDALAALEHLNHMAQEGCVDHIEDRLVSHAVAVVRAALEKQTEMEAALVEACRLGDEGHDLDAHAGHPPSLIPDRCEFCEFLVAQGWTNDDEVAVQPVSQPADPLESR